MCILWMLSVHCSCAYVTPLYSVHLWHSYRARTMQRFKVVYNDAMRFLFQFPRWPISQSQSVVCVCWSAHMWCTFKTNIYELYILIQAKKYILTQYNIFNNEFAWLFCACFVLLSLFLHYILFSCICPMGLK